MAAVEAVFNFSITTPGPHRIDLGQCASIINRKLERQGKQWVIQSIELNTNQSGYIEVSRAPNNWATCNAWVKAYKHWQEQQWEAAEDAGQESKAAKWRDFKIFLNAAHANAGMSANLLPDNVGTFTGLYEWSASEVAVPNDGAAGVTNDYVLHLIGADNSGGANPSKGLVHEYANSRERPQSTDPNIVDVPMGGLYGAMTDVGDDMEEIIANFSERGSTPPYEIGDVSDPATAGEEYYFGGANQGSTITECRLISSGAGNIRTTAGGFIANCGLLTITTGAGDEEISNAILRIRMAVDDKGYVTRPMLEGN